MSNQSPGDQGKNKDINHVLADWDFEAGAINVRKIEGADGLPKLQMRLDLGLLQMEMTGRPDGRRPRGSESWLDFHESELRKRIRLSGSESGFILSRRQCSDLREEAGLYYHRYLGLFVLEDFTGVVRDTSRNLRVLDLCSRYAAHEQDRLMLEQYRPYITMMNARAQASIEIQAGQLAEALKTTQRALKRIRRFFESFEQEKLYDRSAEVRTLRRFAREIRKKLPVDPIKQLQLKLNKAVLAERYEVAATLRDQIEVLKRNTADA